MGTPTHPLGDGTRVALPAARSTLDLALVLAGVVALAALAGWSASRGCGGARDDAPLASLRLEARLDLAGHGAWYGFTAPGAGTLRLRVSLPPGVRGTFVWGPLGTPAPGDPPHLPALLTAERVPVEGPMAEPLVRRLAALGPHVIFIEQPPLAMGGMGLEAALTLELVLDAAPCPATVR